MTATTDLLAFQSDTDDGSWWVLNTHNKHSALTEMRSLNDPPDEWDPTSDDLPDFEALWTTQHEECGDLIVTPVAADTPGATPAIRWRP